MIEPPRNRYGTRRRALYRVSTIDDTNLPICRYASVDSALARNTYARVCVREADAGALAHVYVTRTREKARPRTHARTRAYVHVHGLHTCVNVTHVGGYLRYLWAIFPIQLLLSKPLPVQHVRNKKLDKIISTSRHGFDSLKLVKSYGAGVRGILFYFLSLRALSPSFSRFSRSLSLSSFCSLPSFPLDAPHLFFLLSLCRNARWQAGNRSTSSA